MDIIGGMGSKTCQNMISILMNSPFPLRGMRRGWGNWLENQTCPATKKLLLYSCDSDITSTNVHLSRLGPGKDQDLDQELDTLPDR